MGFRSEGDIKLEGDKPFDIGFQSGLHGQTIFDCPYDHKSSEGLRRRHEWLNGYLTALAEKRVADIF